MVNKILILLFFTASMHAMEETTHLRLADSITLENGDVLRSHYEKNNQKLIIRTFHNHLALHDDYLDWKQNTDLPPFTDVHVLGLTRGPNNSILIPFIAQIKNENDTVVVTRFKASERKWRYVLYKTELLPHPQEDLDFLCVRLYSNPAKKIIINALAKKHSTEEILGIRAVFSDEDEKVEWETVRRYLASNSDSKI